MSILDYHRPRTRARILRGDSPYWMTRDKRAARIRRCVLSFPPWVSRQALRAIWDECKRLERLYGEPYHVAHIVPLNHPHVSGLSVPWNLMPKPGRVNLAEGNRWLPDQMEMFDEHEQLRLEI